MITPVTNVASLTALRHLGNSQKGLNTALTRLSTGRRINSGKDDPAGLISSERLAAALRTLEAESKGYQRQNSSANISDGRISELSTLYRDLQGLVVASANTAGLSSNEIAANQTQVDSIVSSIQRFSNEAVTSLDGIALPGTGNADVANALNQAAASAATVASGGANSLNSGNLAAAQTALNSAIDGISTSRGTIGAYQKYDIAPRITSGQIAYENIAESRSIIADADYAVETSNLTRFQILTEYGINLLKISQQQSRSVLDLISK